MARNRTIARRRAAESYHYPQGASFSPTDIENLSWFDPYNDVYQDSALTTVANDGNPVGGWVNQGLSGNDASQAGSLRPTYETDAFGTGLPGLLLSGAQQMDINWFAALVAGADKPFSVCMALKQTSLLNSRAFFGISSAASAQMFFYTSSSTSYGFLRDDDGVNRKSATGGVPDTNTKVVTLLFDGTTFTMRVNGNVVINGVDANNGIATFTTAAIGCLPDPTPTFPLIGYVGDVALKPSVFTADEIADLEEFVASRCGVTYPFDLVSVTAPKPYQMVQRTGTTADIAINGLIYASGSHDVEARWNGGTWTTIATAATGSYSGTLSAQSQGQGTLEVRLADEPTRINSVPYVGIGDVFVCAGQSNMSGRGTNNQVYSHATLKATLYGNNNVWQELFDPYDSPTSQVDAVSSDTFPAAAGSFIPLLASQIMSNQNIPVAFVPCAKGGTSITAWQPGANHLDRTTLYGSMNYRITQAVGVKAVLWWQGEQDAVAAMAEATYNGHLDTLADAINADQSIALMACKLQNSSGAADADELAINNAIGTAWSDNANVLQGPDLSDIASDDSFHLQSNTKLQTAADRWYAAIAAALYP